MIAFDYNNSNKCKKKDFLAVSQCFLYSYSSFNFSDDTTAGCREKKPVRKKDNEKNECRFGIHIFKNCLYASEACVEKSLL